MIHNNRAVIWFKSFILHFAQYWMLNVVTLNNRF